MTKSIPKRKKSARDAPKSLLVAHWWDGEALGLILLGVGVVMTLTMYAPSKYAGILSILKATFTDSVGWSAYVLPIFPVVFGLILVARHSIKSALRITAGTVIVIIAALFATGLMRPEQAGAWMSGLARPLKVLGPLAYLLAAFVGSLGLEIIANWSPLLIARNIARVTALGLAWLVLNLRTTFHAARENAARLAVISRLRGLLNAHVNDIGGLEQVYPGAGELSSWKIDAQNTLMNLSSLDDKGFLMVEKDLLGWSKLVSGFTNTRAKELAAQISTEDAGAVLVLDEIKNLLGKALTGSSQTIRSLEGVRRALQLDLDTLFESAKREKRDRDASIKALGASIRPKDLSLEIERHASRSAGSLQLLERAQALLERVQAYPGWPEFALKLDKALLGSTNTEIVQFSTDLAHTLRTDRSDALPELAQWAADLDVLEAKIVAEANATLEAEVLSLNNTVPDAEKVKNLQLSPSSTVFAASGLGTLSSPFSVNAFSSSSQSVLANATVAVQDDQMYEAVFEMEFPGGNHVSGEDMHAYMRGTHTNPNGLEMVDLELENDDSEDNDEHAPWISPSERAAAKIEAAKSRDIEAAKLRNLHSKPPAEGIADSSVGERLRAPTVPIQGGIPIQVPGFSFLDPVQASGIDLVAFDRDARARANIIDLAFQNFGIQAKVVDFARGPTVTRYEVEPAPGEKIARVQSIQNDLARVLAVGGVRIEAPVPGKNVIGLEVPNADREPVTFRTGIEAPSYSSHKAKLPLLLGKSIDGEMVVGDLGKMPHLLIAGSTGSGKSVCVNTLIMSLLFRYLPTQLRFVMVDPKMVELTPYDGIPHLVRPVVTNPTDAAGVLLGCVGHMERRYKMMSEVGAKNLEQYNEKARISGDPELPYLVIIIDELADLMITSPKEVEASIMRLAQMARATGMHLILATQRPSADVVTGLIKVNIPARAAFAVSSGIDSRTILDSTGAERLTGYGDMLFYQPGLVKSVRLQGPYISENELARITEFLRRQFFDDDFGESYGSDFDGVLEASSGGLKGQDIDFGDPFIKKAAEIVIEEGYAAVSRLQRRLSVGHARAGKLIDALEAMGIVGPYKGSKSREVTATRDQLPEYFG